MDALLGLIPLATIIVLFPRSSITAERRLRTFAFGLQDIALWAFTRSGISAHFEGFVLGVSLALLVQGTLMLLALGKGSADSSVRDTRSLP